MFIHTIELREIRLPLIHFFETSFGRTTEGRIIFVRVVDKDGAGQTWDRIRSQSNANRSSDSEI